MERRPLSNAAIREHFGRPSGEIIDRADRHTMSVQRWLSTRSPRAVTVWGRGVTLGSSGLAVPLLNLALGGRFENTDRRTVAQEIRAIIAFFKGRQVPWLWWVGPQVHPPDLGARLARQDLALHSHLPALAARLPAPVPAADPDVQVWRARSKADLQAASEIRRAAFRFPANAASSYFEDCAQDWLAGGSRNVRLFLARIGAGPPAAIGALILGAGYPGIYVMATLPAWQRRGLGHAIMTRLMQTANATGCDLAFLTASRLGYPLYRRFGFEHIFDYQIFQGPGP